MKSNKVHIKKVVVGEWIKWNITVQKQTKTLLLLKINSRSQPVLNSITATYYDQADLKEIEMI